MGYRDFIVVFVFLVLTIAAIILAFLSAPVAVAFVGGIAAVLLVFFKPFIGLILYIVLTYLRPQDFNPGLTKLRVMLFFAALIIISFLVHKIFRREKISFVPTKQHILMLVLLGIVPLSNLANYRFAGAWDGFNEFLKLFMPFFVITMLVDDLGKLRKVCWVSVACMTLLSANGILQHFRGYDVIGNTMIEGRIRWITVFGDPNDFALAIDSLLPFVLVGMFDGGLRVAKRLVLGAVASLFVLALYFTNSRGGFTAFVLMVVYFGYRRWGLLKGIVIAAVVAVAAVALAPSRMSELSPYEASASGRVNAWIAGLGMLKSHPIFGVGFNYFEAYNNWRAAHSAFVECFAELGAVGYFVWLWLIYGSFAALVETERRGSPGHRTYALMLELSLIGFLGSALFLSQAFSPVFYILIALASALSGSTGAAVPLSRSFSPREILVTAAITAGSIVGFKIMAILYY